jgi:hypothetical protein
MGNPEPPQLTKGGGSGLSPTVETAYLTSAAIFTRTLGIVPLFALPTSVGWYHPGLLP